jgi:hypothetical protein
MSKTYVLLLLGFLVQPTYAAFIPGTYQGAATASDGTALECQLEFEQHDNFQYIKFNCVDKDLRESIMALPRNRTLMKVDYEPLDGFYRLDEYNPFIGFPGTPQYETYYNFHRGIFKEAQIVRERYDLGEFKVFTEFRLYQLPDGSLEYSEYRYKEPAKREFAKLRRSLNIILTKSN